MPVIGKPSQQPATPLFSVGWWLGSFSDNLDNLGRRIEGIFIIGDYLAYPFRSLAFIISVAERKVYDADEFLAEVWTWLKGIIEGYAFLNLLYWASGHFWAIRNQPVNWVKAQLGAIAWWFGWLMFEPRNFVNHFIRQLSYAIGLIIDNPREFLNRYLRQLSWAIGLLLDNPREFINHYLRQLSWIVALIMDNPKEFIRRYLLSIQPLLNLLLYSPRDFVVSMLRQHNPDLALLIDNPLHWLRLKLVSILSVDWYFLNDPVKYVFDKIMQRLRNLIEPYLSILVQYVIEIILRYM